MTACSVTGAQPALNRTVLSIPEPQIPRSTVLDARNAKAPPRLELKALAKAPYVLIVLIDDMGFGAVERLRRACQVPTLERMAKGGLRYDQFHTTSLCSPTRQALLSGSWFVHNGVPKHDCSRPR
jgi:hypothetical protein